MSLFDNRLKYVTTKTWDATRPDFDFPERADPELKVDGLAQKPNLGLAFSGGGTRSATATLGQLRALHELGILRQARYLSCVSGSSFPSAAFTFLPEEQEDGAFLGPIVEPGDVTFDLLARSEPDAFAGAIANSYLLDDFLKNALGLAGDETYARAIGDNFLRPFGLGDQARFFSLNQKSLAAILAHNPTMTAGDFYLARPDRPFLIINAILLRPDNEPPLAKKVPLETTPLYAGIRPLYPGAGSRGRDIGGGYLEPFAFDSDAPDEAPATDGRVTVRLGATRHRYSLADAIGTSGAAPAEGLAEKGLTFVGFPEFKHWPLTNIGHTVAKEYEFGDGGNLENLGLMPLLARGVQRIIAFVNTRHPLTGGDPGQINGSIPPLFGQTPGFISNAVFPAGDYPALVEGLLAAKSDGRTVLHRDRYEVQANPFHGLSGGWEVEILWVYNERVPAWEMVLPGQISRLIGRDSLENFPHYRTYGQNKPAIVDLRPEQVFLLSHLSCWNVLNNADLFLSMLD